MRKSLFSCILLISCTFLYSCTNDITKTHDTFKELCESSGGQWLEGDLCKCPRDGACTKGVTCINGVCANNICSATEEGSTRCTNDDNKVGQMQKCQNNQWIPDNLPSCNGYSCNEAGTKCSECHKDQTSCEDKNGKSFRKRCADGAWLEVECPNVSCHLDSNNDKADCGECKNGETRCANGKIEECKNGSWNFVDDCPSKECLQDGKECSECTSGTTQCVQGKSGQNAQYDTCIFGQWAKIMQNCDSPECKDTKCAVLNCNDTYEDKCMGNTISTCKEGQVETNVCIKQGNVVDCKNPKACGDCKNNDTECKENKLYTCDNAMWQTEPTAECHCNDKMTACQPCYKEGETQCSNNAQETCILIGDNLVWSAPKACENGKTCINDKCAESNTDVPCTPNQKQCTNENETQFITCDENGQWGEPASCDRGKKCVDGECVDSKECESGQKCINDVMNVCQDYKWEPRKDLCRYGCKEGTSECYNCNPSKTVVCNNKYNKKNELVKCNSGILGDTVERCTGDCTVTNNGEDDYCNCVLRNPICEDGNVCACQDNKKVCGEPLCIANQVLSCNSSNELSSDICTPTVQKSHCQDCNCTNGNIFCEDKRIIPKVSTGMHYRCDNGKWKELGYCLTYNKSTMGRVTLNVSPCTKDIPTNKNCACDVVCTNGNDESARYQIWKCSEDGILTYDAKASFNKSDFKKQLNNLFPAESDDKDSKDKDSKIDEFIMNIITCDEMKTSFIIESNDDSN